MKTYLISPGLVLFFILCGCSTAYRNTVEYPPASPLGKAVQKSEKDSSATKIVSDHQIIKKLTLNKALNLTLKNNPDLAASTLEIQARQAKSLQLSLMPNPELGVQVENFAGNDDMSKFDSTETTVMLSQDILLAGKIKKRTRVAELKSDLAAWDYEIKILDLFTRVKKTFIEVLAAQKKIELNKELLKIADGLLENINRRVKAGKVNAAEASRAKFFVSKIKIDIRNAEQDLQAAKHQIASYWGSSLPNFIEAEGVLDSPLQIPGMEKFQKLLKQNPSLARYEKELSQRRAVIDLEKARAVPDINLGAGIRRLNETNDSAFVVGISIPLPVRNRNQGGIAEAKIRYDKTKMKFKALERRLNAELSLLYKRLNNSYNEAVTLNRDMLPDAENAFKIIKQGNLLGRFTILDVLDAQRTLFDIRSQHLRAITGFQIAKAEIERLIAQEIKTIKNNTGDKIDEKH